jgi:purine-binding chemotaxis protein CheW
MNDKAQRKSAADARQVLRARARALARTPEPDRGAAASLAVLEFHLGGERYAVETRYVTEVMPLEILTPLPCTPPFVAGIVNVRGRIVMVLDLKKFFGLPDGGLTDSHRIIHVEGNGLELALLADVSIGMRSVVLEDLQAPLPTLSGIRADYLRGITGDPLMVIDMARILADPDIIVHEEVDKEA